MLLVAQIRQSEVEEGDTTSFVVGVVLGDASWSEVLVVQTPTLFLGEAASGALRVALSAAAEIQASLALGTPVKIAPSEVRLTPTAPGTDYSALFSESTIANGVLDSEVWYTDDTKSTPIRKDTLKWAGNRLLSRVSSYLTATGVVGYTRTTVYSTGTSGTIKVTETEV
jgi:hypothetical protein